MVQRKHIQKEKIGQKTLQGKLRKQVPHTDDLKISNLEYLSIFSRESKQVKKIVLIICDGLSLQSFVILYLVDTSHNLLCHLFFLPCFYNVVLRYKKFSDNPKY